jgi:hypothetical protein
MTFNSIDQHNRARSRMDPPLQSPRQLALIALGVWLVGVIFHPLALLVPLGLLLLVAAGVAYLMRPKKQSMYWRGREIDLDDNDGPAQQLYRQVFKH